MVKVDSLAITNQTLKLIAPKNIPFETPHSMTSRIIQAPITPARANFERFAEEMEPQDYIKMRSYLSDLEMHQLMESGMF